MIKVRNNFVALRLIKESEPKVGKVFVLENSQMFGEAEVVGVGPGNVSAAGGRSDTFDLKVGQRVWVKHSQYGPSRVSGGGPSVMHAGINYRDGDVEYLIVAETSIIGILAEPVDATDYDAR